MLVLVNKRLASVRYRLPRSPGDACVHNPEWELALGPTELEGPVLDIPDEDANEDELTLLDIVGRLRIEPSGSGDRGARRERATSKYHKAASLSHSANLIQASE